MGRDKEAKVIRDIIDSIYDSYDADALSRWSLYPDTKSVINSLKNIGVKVGIVSSIGKLTIEKAVEKFELLSNMDLVISRNDVIRLKPSCVVIYMSTNDIREGISVEQSILNLNIMIKKAQENKY